MTTDLDHLSYSSISKYQCCPRSWRFHYLDRVETPISPNLVFGSAFHGAVEDYLSARVLDPPVGTLQAFWDKHWARQLAEPQEIAWGDDTREDTNNLGIRMLTQPEIVDVLDAIEPLIVADQPVIEKRVTLLVPGVPIPVIGYIDLVENDGIPADFKTSSRSWSAQRAAEETQPLFYLAALNQEGDDRNPDLHFRHYVFTKTKPPKIQIWETQRRPGELFWLFGAIVDTYNAIAAGIFPPDPTTWLCNPKWCDFWDLCRGGL